MDRIARSALAVCAFVACAGTAWFAFHRTEHKAHRNVAPPTYPLPRSEPDLRSFVQKNQSKADAQVQELVGAARIRLGYAAANHRDWSRARAAFRTAEKEYRGTGAMSADWGGVADQAAYQAAVCLVGSGQKEKARAELVRFMKERPLSPLVFAAQKRLIRLNGGQSTAEYDRLLKLAIAKQEARVRFETSVCGPKTIEYLTAHKRIPGVTAAADYKRMAKLCATTDKGTTIEGMRRGLGALGVPSSAYRLNRADLARAPLPAIVLEGDHYVALTAIDGDQARVYDTRFSTERSVKLPPLDDPDFSLNVILFTPSFDLKRP